MSQFWYHYDSAVLNSSTPVLVSCGFLEAQCSRRLRWWQCVEEMRICRCQSWLESACCWLLILCHFGGGYEILTKWQFHQVVDDDLVEHHLSVIFSRLVWSPEAPIPGHEPYSWQCQAVWLPGVVPSRETWNKINVNVTNYCVNTKSVCPMLSRENLANFILIYCSAFSP